MIIYSVCFVLILIDSAQWRSFSLIYTFVSPICCCCWLLPFDLISGLSSLSYRWLWSATSDSSRKMVRSIVCGASSFDFVIECYLRFWHGDNLHWYTRQWHTAYTRHRRRLIQPASSTCCLATEQWWIRPGVARQGSSCFRAPMKMGWAASVF